MYKEKCQEEMINYEDYFYKKEGIDMKKISELNMLSLEENLRLAVTPHISEIVFLILQGLRRALSDVTKRD